MGKYNTDPYMESIKRYAEQLRKALEVADDPFKAPELVVYTAVDVQRVAWDMQVEYTAMMHYKDNIVEERPDAVG